MQGNFHTLSQIDMAATSSVPFVGLYIFPCRAMLEIKFSLAVEHMQMNDGMQYFTTIVSMPPAYGTEDITLFIYNRKLFVFIIYHIDFLTIILIIKQPIYNVAYSSEYLNIW